VKRYGDFEAVAGITFDVAGEKSSGCLDRTRGKSTLIRMMTTLTPSTADRYRWWSAWGMTDDTADRIGPLATS